MRFLKTYTQLFEEQNEDKKKLCCAMVSFDVPLMSAIQSAIDPADLHENGIEDEPHVTLLFGLHQDEVDPNAVLDVVCGCECGEITLGPASLFKNEKYDVLKFDASADWLHKVNGELRKMPHTNDFPDYKPHCTIAYLQPGLGEKYMSVFEGLTYNVKPKEFIYSDSDRNKTKRPANAA